jgi:AAA15 family ATPase/GTPase
MIAEFTVENYRSFKERHTFSLVPTKNKELSELTVFRLNEKVSFLRTAVLYGANASGKSNLFLALVFFLKFSVHSGPQKQVGDVIEIEPFAFSRQTESAPSNFEIIFYIRENDNETTRYRYGFSVTNEQVEYEYLFAVNKVREITLFTRKRQKIECTSYYKEGTRGKSSVRNNCTFLSVCAQNNGEISGQIVSYFKRINVLFGMNNPPVFLKKEFDNPVFQKKIINFLKFADIQIMDIKQEPVPVPFQELGDPDVAAILRNKFSNMEQLRILFGHTFYDGETPVGQKFISDLNESMGTQKLFSYSGTILLALEQGTPLFIDEFDTSLHPLIIEAIIKLFNSPITNPRNAQLVISCHTVNILTNRLFRRDQIWFCEKDQCGATDLYSLAEYMEPVRNDAAFGKNYLQGKYGAIPYINEIFLQIGTQK